MSEPGYIYKITINYMDVECDYVNESHLVCINAKDATDAADMLKLELANDIDGVITIVSVEYLNEVLLLEG